MLHFMCSLITPLVPKKGVRIWSAEDVKKRTARQNTYLQLDTVGCVNKARCSERTGCMSVQLSSTGDSAWSSCSSMGKSSANSGTSFHAFTNSQHCWW